MFCGTDIIIWNIPIFSVNGRIFYRILSVVEIFIMDLYNVMDLGSLRLIPALSYLGKGFSKLYSTSWCFLF